MMLYHKLNSLLLRGTAERRWVREADPDTGSLYVVQEIRGQTVGILGYGHIGRETARMAIALGAKVVACSRDGKIKKASGYIVVSGLHGIFIPPAGSCTDLEIIYSQGQVTRMVGFPAHTLLRVQSRRSTPFSPPAM